MRTGIASDIDNPGNIGAFFQHVDQLSDREIRMGECIEECTLASACIESACGYTLVDDACDRLCANHDEVRSFSCGDIEASVLTKPGICRSSQRLTASASNSTTVLSWLRETQNVQLSVVLFHSTLSTPLNSMLSSRKDF